MNILRHKKWHVRTKENVARVRRDEAKAAEEERARAERATLAENEDRVRRLKTRASAAATVASASEIFGGGVVGTSGNLPAAAAAMASAEKQQHVNLFAELEEQERTNTAVGNREYAAERKKEQDDWESKVGIMKRFAEDTKEYAKESEWWEGIPLVREKVAKKGTDDDNGDDDKTTLTKCRQQKKKFMTEEEKRMLKTMRKKDKKEERKREKRKKKRRRHSSSLSSGDSSSTDSDAERKQKAKLDALRKERMARERQEQAKAKQLFVKPEEPKKEEKTAKSAIEEDRQRRYNTQFNPDFARS